MLATNWSYQVSSYFCVLTSANYVHCSLRVSLPASFTTKSASHLVVKLVGKQMQYWVQSGISISRSKSSTSDGITAISILSLLRNLSSCHCQNFCIGQTSQHWSIYAYEQLQQLLSVSDLVSKRSTLCQRFLDMLQAPQHCVCRHSSTEQPCWIVESAQLPAPRHLQQHGHFRELVWLVQLFRGTDQWSQSSWTAPKGQA